MQNVTQMIALLKTDLGVSKDKEVEIALGMRPMALASLKRENRVGSFLKFLVPFCQREDISVDSFLVGKATDAENINGTNDVGNTVASPEQKRRDEEMESLKDELISQFKINQKLQSDIIERDRLILSLKDKLLEKPKSSSRKAI